MIGDKKVIAVLTVTDNSKRFPGKTFAEFGGHPLLWNTLNKILFKCKYIDTVVIDSPHPDKIADKISHYNARDLCKFIKRKPDLSSDNVPILTVLKSFRDFSFKIDPTLKRSDYIVWVDYTKPLTSVETIETCIEVAYGNGYDSVATVKPLRGNLLGDEAVCSQLKPDKEKRFLYFGAVRLRTVETLFNAELGTWGYGKKHRDLPIIKDWEMDIDYEHDLVQARALYKYFEEKKNG